MSQAVVESVVGRLITDDAFRRQFLSHPEQALARAGARLTTVEIAALRSIEGAVLAHVATALDDRIRRADVESGVERSGEDA